LQPESELDSGFFISIIEIDHSRTSDYYFDMRVTAVILIFISISRSFAQQPEPAKECCTPGRILHCAAIVTAGGAAFAFDRDLREFYQRPRLHGKTADDIINTFEDLGKETPYFFIIPAFLGYGAIAKDDRSFRTGGEMATGLLGSLAVTWGVKRAFGRLRPYQSLSPYDFFEGGRSFYSGHTITVFTAATIVASEYQRQNLGFIGIDHDIPLVPILVYSAAGMVGVQRLYSDVHWSSDVYFGALAGYGMGKLTTYVWKRVDFGLKFGSLNNTPGLSIVINID